MPRAKKGVKTVSELFREMLQNHPDISAKEAVERMRKEHGRSAHAQTFYTIKSALRKAAGGVAQKRRKRKIIRHREVTPQADYQFELRVLRMENRRLKDVLMRFMLDE